MIRNYTLDLLMDKFIAVNVEDPDTHLYAYADDLVVTTKGNTRNALEIKLNWGLEIIHSWAEIHKLKMSVRKCCYMTFGPKMPRDPPIRIGIDNNKSPLNT